MTSAAQQTPLRLMETFRSLFYTPIYVALSGGFLESEGLDVQFSTCPAGYHGLSAMNADLADIVQAGPMRSIIAADWGAEVVPPHFIEINSRDGFFLVGRRPEGEFRWDDLEGASIIPVGFSPMPVASLRYAVEGQGVDWASIRQTPDLSLAEATARFEAGEGDYIHLPQPAVEQLLEEGSGHLAAALGPVNGHISYSSFATTNRFIASNSEAVHAFTRGFYNAQRWLAENDAATVGASVSSFFPEFQPEVVVKAVARYKAQDTWATDPLLREDGYEALQDVLVGAGLAKARQPYRHIIRTDFAEAAMGLA